MFSGYLGKKIQINKYLNNFYLLKAQIFVTIFHPKMDENGHIYESQNSIQNLDECVNTKYTKIRLLVLSFILKNSNNNR